MREYCFLVQESEHYIIFGEGLLFGIGSMKV